MATYFQEGKTYTNSATAYGLRPRDQRNDTAAASMPAVTLVCTAVTPTHVTFKFANPKGSGATYNIGWLLGTTQRCRVYRDTLGLYAAPLGRRRGMIIVRP
jgi:hypothetical protein